MLIHPNPPRPPLPILTKGDWVMRTQAAATTLIESGQYSREHFCVLARADERPTLSMSHLYPRRWADHLHNGALGGWVAERSIPDGLTLYWPKGVDHNGEAHDADDPILLLAELQWWDTMPDEVIIAHLNSAGTDSKTVEG